jgi:hypothetical protein
MSQNALFTHIPVALVSYYELTVAILRVSVDSPRSIPFYCFCLILLFLSEIRGYDEFREVILAA